VTALGYPVVVPSSEPRDSGKDVYGNNDYGFYDDGQKSASGGIVYALYARRAHFLINPPTCQLPQRDKKYCLAYQGPSVDVNGKYDSAFAW